MKEKGMIDMTDVKYYATHEKKDRCIELISNIITNLIVVSAIIIGVIGIAGALACMYKILFML